MVEKVARELISGVPEMDFNIGYRYFLGNMNNYVQALLSILKSMKAKLPILETMYRTGEFSGLRTITQTLQRMMNNVGAVDMAELSYQLETSLLNDREDELKELLDQYIHRIYRFSEHLEALLQGMDIKNMGKSDEEQPSFLNYDFTKTKESIKLSADLLERRII